MDLASLLDDVREIPEYRRYGRVTGVSGLLREIGLSPGEERAELAAGYAGLQSILGAQPKP